MSEVSAPPRQLPAHGVRLVIAYDGSDFCGFQLQADQRTVQGELERAAEQMTGHPVRVRGAGRTDSGVHALGQVVSFDSARAIRERGWLLGLNQFLPDDIRVQKADACPPGYDPRFDSLGKIYRYVIQLGEAKNPLLRKRAWQVGPMRLDVSAMRAAAAMLVGTHDFSAFRAADDLRPNTVRTLWSLQVLDGYAGDPTLLGIQVSGTAFMKNMVRILAGTLLEVGLGRIAVSRVPELLVAGAQREQAGRTAPAHGLTLVAVALGRLALVAQGARGPLTHDPFTTPAPDEGVLQPGGRRGSERHVGG